jgi:hypothetical protein
MDPKAQRALVVGLIGIGLVISRRWKNPDRQAGLGIAGWTLFIVWVLGD